ncbi:NUDIX hydrolase [Shimia haliotis]|uniref:8-oxo-dGTP pyrophosphatase MutT, NUDIX family n=1 Tax=Shimia haliotis TaxID=1280847 RepID=A0A1I4CXA9_9RHOB|nr:NUDIX hydrolase [Shimia haliotis]SFK84521.1 8-oxo-dGTP pyrophosphatase MutT, NUDIX family [Shimia haliotis]
MTSAFKRAYDSVLAPLLQRPRRLQVAALCLRSRGGHREVLLVTSRDTGRWVLPKGWPIRGMDAAGSALQEAWEEAGVREANMNTSPVGTYGYDKRLDSGLELPVEVKVFEAQVTEMLDKFPESDERTRKWVRPDDAADMVNEPELQALLRDI